MSHGLSIPFARLTLCEWFHVKSNLIFQVYWCHAEHIPHTPFFPALKMGYLADVLICIFSMCGRDKLALVPKHHIMKDIGEVEVKLHAI
jgi:hypothetical protein